MIKCRCLSRPPDPLDVSESALSKPTTVVLLPFGVVIAPADKVRDFVRSRKARRMRKAEEGRVDMESL